MITFENVTKRYNTNVGLEHANIHIGKGDFVFLIGPTGAGKSTFIKLIMKEISADEGRIIVGGKDITRLSKREIPQLRRKIGIVFQDFRLLPKKTVYENVAFALEAVHRSKRIIRSRVPAVLEVVGIKDKAKKYPEELSAGEQQRVAIARAIINNPDLLIADEPTGNLDPVTAMGIMDLLQEINETGTTVVMVTHAKDIVDRMHKRVVAIEKGHIVRDEYGEYGYEEKTHSGDEKPVFAEDELKSGLVFDDEDPLTENGVMPEEAGEAEASATVETASTEGQEDSAKETAVETAEEIEDKASESDNPEASETETEDEVEAKTAVETEVEAEADAEVEAEAEAEVAAEAEAEAENKTEVEENNVVNTAAIAEEVDLAKAIEAAENADMIDVEEVSETAINPEEGK